MPQIGVQVQRGMAPSERWQIFIRVIHQSPSAINHVALLRADSTLTLTTGLLAHQGRLPSEFSRWQDLKESCKEILDEGVALGVSGLFIQVR